MDNWALHPALITRTQASSRIFIQLRTMSEIPNSKVLTNLPPLSSTLALCSGTGTISHLEFLLTSGSCSTTARSLQIRCNRAVLPSFNSRVYAHQTLYIIHSPTPIGSPDLIILVNRHNTLCFLSRWWDLSGALSHWHCDERRADKWTSTRQFVPKVTDPMSSFRHEQDSLWQGYWEEQDSAAAVPDQQADSGDPTWFPVNSSMVVIIQADFLRRS